MTYYKQSREKKGILGQKFSACMNNIFFIADHNMIIKNKCKLSKSAKRLVLLCY